MQGHGRTQLLDWLKSHVSTWQYAKPVVCITLHTSNWTGVLRLGLILWLSLLPLLSFFISIFSDHLSFSRLSPATSLYCLSWHLARLIKAFRVPNLFYNVGNSAKSGLSTSNPSHGVRRWGKLHLSRVVQQIEQPALTSDAWCLSALQ